MADMFSLISWKLRSLVTRDMLEQISVGLLVGFVMVGCYSYYYYYVAAKPPSPNRSSAAATAAKVVKLSDGRRLAFRERGVPKDEAKHKIVVSHAFADSKDFDFPISQDLLDELGIYILSFDRAGYGDSDPNPKRSVKTEAFDIQELVDALQLGPKFYLVGLSLGAYAVYGSLKYIPHRLSGATLIVPMANYWWRCFPAKISEMALHGLPAQDRRTFRIAHYAPRLLYWWMTQKWFPTLSAYEGKTDAFSRSDIEMLKQMASARKQEDHPEQISYKEQSVHESLFRDLTISFGKWEFEPTDIVNPFPNNEGRVHLWQGCEDKVFPVELNRQISLKLPWIRYHEVADAGHLLIHNKTHCEAVFRALVSA